MTWKNIVNLETVEIKKEMSHERYHTECTPLAEAMGAKKLGYNVSVMQPGEFSCPYHFHHSEEELFLVLEGKAMLRQADRYKEVCKGDLVFFENNREGAHQLYNHTDQPFRYFALSTKDRFEICEYPDSKKISVSRLGKVFQLGAEVDYLKGEENLESFWPKELLSMK